MLYWRVREAEICPPESCCLDADLCKYFLSFSVLPDGEAVWSTVGKRGEFLDVIFVVHSPGHFLTGQQL